MNNVLYIHGMGGGGDSRIPSILADELAADGVSVVARTYDFDPEVAAEQIAIWIEELKPVLVLGESLGALHALKIQGVPRIFVSPAINAAFYFEVLSWLVLIPGVTQLFDRIYRPREGDRQTLHFTRKVLKKYMPHRKGALEISTSDNRHALHAFFGVRDHYRKSGIVSVKAWEKHYGDTYTLYDGTHFMEDEFVRTLLVARVRDVLLISV